MCGTYAKIMGYDDVSWGYIMGFQRTLDFNLSMALASADQHVACVHDNEPTKNSLLNASATFSSQDFTTASHLSQSRISLITAITMPKPPFMNLLITMSS
jgi:hypothetical protein